MDVPKGSRQGCILILGGFTTGDKYDIWIIQSADENNSLDPLVASQFEPRFEPATINIQQMCWTGNGPEIIRHYYLS